MAQSSQLVHELLSALPSIKTALRNSNPARQSGLPLTQVGGQNQEPIQQFERKLLDLLGSLRWLRAVAFSPNSNPRLLQYAKERVFSYAQDLGQIHLRMKGLIYPSFKNDPPQLRYGSTALGSSSGIIWDFFGGPSRGGPVPSTANLRVRGQMHPSLKTGPQEYLTRFKSADQMHNSDDEILITILKTINEEERISNKAML